MAPAVIASIITVAAAYASYVVGRWHKRKDKMVESAEREERAYKDLLQDLLAYIESLTYQNPRYRKYLLCRDTSDLGTQNAFGEDWNWSGIAIPPLP